jgi:hypothetical protein
MRTSSVAVMNPVFLAPMGFLKKVMMLGIPKISVKSIRDAYCQKYPRRYDIYIHYIPGKNLNF